jgi:glycosyltransferase involved in cell wall biosynthesis
VARLGVYTDYTYSLREGRPHAERAFALFVAALAERFERTVLIGRLDPAGEARYPLGEVELCPLSNYPSLSHTLPALRGMLGSLRPFWRALRGLDVIWILGPHPLAFPFALLARLRGCAVVLGVRQDTVAYVRNRHPGSRGKQALAKLMDAGFRALGRRWPVVVVGPAIAEAYRDSPRLLEISVSLVSRSQIADSEKRRARDYSGELRALSVGRLEAEKNPVALADVLADLRRRDERWRLVVCGEGELRPALESRLRELGVDGYAELLGYLGHDSALGDQYRRAHALVLVSWTEGLPQVLYEAFAAGLPVAATDVGGIAAAAGDAVLLVPPGDPERMAASLARIGEDPALREALVRRGLALVSERTLESETARVAAFIQAAERQRTPSYK